MALVNRDYTDGRNFYKKSSSPKRCSDFEIISQERSLADPFQKLFAKFCNVNEHGYGEWVLLALKGHEEIFIKSLLLRKRWSENVPLVTLFKNCSRKFDPSINMAPVNGGFLHYM